MEEKRGRGRPPGSTKATGYKGPSARASSPSVNRDDELRTAIKPIIQSRELRGELIIELFKPEHRKLLNEDTRFATETLRLLRENRAFWIEEALRQREDWDLMLATLGHKEPHGRGVGA
jgi:hypothetical protein